MRIFKKICFNFIITFLLLVGSVTYSYSKVEISDFSFIGKEVAELNVMPVYKSISVDFKQVKQVDTYIEKLKVQTTEIEKDNYTSDEPGFMFSGRFGTSFSSAFIGSKAYKNYLAKMYLKEDYINVIEGYKKYKEKLKGTAFEDECTFLYSVSLMKVGYYQQSVDTLKDLSNKENFFGNLAQEFIFEYFKSLSKTDEIVDFAKNLKNFTPYSLYVYVDTLFNINKYEDIVYNLEKYPSYLDNYRFFYDYLAYAKYVLNKGDEVLLLEDKVTKNSYPVFADLYLKNGDLDRSKNYIDKIEDDILKKYFMIKMEIYQGKYDEATEELKKIDSENLKLNLLFELISKDFDNLDANYLDRFHFENPQNLDFKNFYKGLIFLRDRDFLNASKNFEKITFNQSLMLNSYFYKGLAYYYTNESLSEVNLKRYILNGKDNDKIDLARLLLGQIYLKNRKRDSALLVLEGCNKIFCQELKGEVFIANNEYDLALDYLKDIDTDRGNYLKAVIYFNKKEYETTVRFLKKINNPNLDTEYLLMAAYFKLNRADDASEIFSKYQDNQKFLDTALNYFFLTGDYKTVLSLIENSNLDTDKYKLYKAKSLYSLKKYNEAEKLFQELIAKDVYVYDAIMGLINVQRVKRGDKNYLAEIFNIIKKKNFDRKDQLVLELALESLNQNDFQNAIYIVNYYFDNFPNAKNNKDAYLIRGEIFKKLKKYNECITDADYVISKFIDTDDAIILKAECLEEVDKKKAVLFYEQLLNNKRFNELSKKKLLDLYNEPKKLIKLAYNFQDTEKITFYNGLEKGLNLVGENSEILKYQKEIDILINSNIKRYTVSGLYFSSLYDFYSNNFDEAAKKSMKAYYFDKDSKYNKLSLQIAINSYKKLNRDDNAEKVKKILENIK